MVPDERLFPFVTNTFLWKDRNRWMREAGVRVIRNHDFRHTVACLLYQKGTASGDPLIVQKVSNLLGHKKLEQTYRYLTGLKSLIEVNEVTASQVW